jgi:hypothetical protein
MEHHEQQHYGEPYGGAVVARLFVYGPWLQMRHDTITSRRLVP